MHPAERRASPASTRPSDSRASPGLASAGYWAPGMGWKLSRLREMCISAIREGQLDSQTRSSHRWFFSDPRRKSALPECISASTSIFFCLLGNIIALQPSTWAVTPFPLILSTLRHHCFSRDALGEQLAHPLLLECSQRRFSTSHRTAVDTGRSSTFLLLHPRI
jgi:hypothetical protein